MFVCDEAKVKSYIFPSETPVPVGAAYGRNRGCIFQTAVPTVLELASPPSIKHTCFVRVAHGPEHG